LIGPAEIEDLLADYRETLIRSPDAWFGPAPVWPLTAPPHRPETAPRRAAQARASRGLGRRVILRASR
jgi:hypothetical protein